MKKTDEKKRKKWLRSKVNKRETLRKFRELKQFVKLKFFTDFYGLSYRCLLRLNDKKHKNCTHQTAQIIEWAYDDLIALKERANDSQKILGIIKYDNHKSGVSV